MPDTIRTDVLVVGSEGAGARAAIAAHDHGAQVLVATKGRIGKSGATVTAIAGIAVGGRGIRDVLRLAEASEDTPEAFFEDIVAEGKFINDQDQVGRIVEQGPLRVRELIDWGMRASASDARIPGHRFPRCLHTSGRQFVGALKRRLKDCPRVRVIEHAMITDLLTAGGEVVGAVGLDLCSGEPLVIEAAAVVLATGGAQMVYPIQTAPEELTGDGLGMACRAGAELIDMEMVQFHPCNLITPPAWKGLGFPFTIGPGGGLRSSWLLNKWGERFMEKWDPRRMENTTRDVLSVAIMSEVLEGRGSPHGGVYLSLSHLPTNLIDDFGQWFRLVKPDWRYGGFRFGELVEEIKRGAAMEVVPACHFFMGGVRIDRDCRSTVPGLFAVGEVAGGCHGANRLSDVALTEVLVHGAIGGAAAARFAGGRTRRPAEPGQAAELSARLLQPLTRREGPAPFEVRKAIQAAAWEKAGVVRSGASLTQAAESVRELREQALPRLCCRSKDRVYNREWIEALQVENLLTVLELIARSALARAESRGAHFRQDHPQMDDETQLSNVVASRVDGRVSVHRLPVALSRCSAPRGKTK